MTRARSGRILRAAAFSATLGARRVRARGRQTLVVGLGLALAAAMVAVAFAGSAAVRDEAVRRELARLGPSRTSVQAVWSGVPAQSDASDRELDRQARTALQPIVGRDPFAIVLYRRASFGGAYVSLGGVDGLARWVKLRSGRLPRPCTAARCELVQVGGSGRIPETDLLRVVGRGTTTRDAPLAAYLGDRGRGQPPILLADGALAVGRLPIEDADLIARTIGWILPIAPGSIHDWQIPDVSHRVAVASAELKARDPIFSISAPLDELAALHERAGVAGTRLLVVGGVAALLVAAFAAFAATRLRRDADASRRRLIWHGASRAQLLAVSLVEGGAVAVAAVVLGWLLGAAGGVVFTHALGADAGAVVDHALASPRAFAIALAIAVVAAVIVVVALHLHPRGFAVFDIAAGAALLAVLLAVARGDVGPSAAGGGTDALLLLLPGLVLLAAAVAGARFLGRVLTGGARRAHRAPPAARLAMLSLSRGGGAVLAAAFLIVAIGAAVFAAAYRSTLVRGQHDQAAFTVPADYVLAEDLERLVTIQAANAPYDRLGHAFEVLRAAGQVPQGPAFTLLAAPAREIAAFEGWRDDFSRLTPSAVAALLAPARSTAMRGIDLPPDATAIELEARVRGDPVALALDIRNRRGDFSVVSLGELAPGSSSARARLPRVARGGKVVALDVAFPPVAAFLAGHVESGSTRSVANASRGTIELVRLAAGGRRLPPFTQWIGTGGVRAETASRVRYFVNRAAESSFRPRQPTDGGAVPVVVTSRLAGLAGAGGEIPLDVNGESITGRVVGVTRFVPSVPHDAVLADLDGVATALNTRAPGTAVVDEVWVRDASPRAAALVERRPFSLLAVRSRAAEEAFLRTEPLARGTLWILILTAVVALLLAFAAVVLTALSDRHDEARELFDLRVQGAPPRTLRSYLRLRSLAVTAAGVVAGVAAGAVLLALVTGFVAVTAGGTEAVPPLALGLDAPLLLGALAAFCVAAAAAVALVTREPA